MEPIISADKSGPSRRALQREKCASAQGARKNKSHKCRLGFGGVFQIKNAAELCFTCTTKRPRRTSEVLLLCWYDTASAANTAALHREGQVNEEMEDALWLSLMIGNRCLISSFVLQSCSGTLFVRAFCGTYYHIKISFYIMILSTRHTSKYSSIPVQVPIQSSKRSDKPDTTTVVLYDTVLLLCIHSNSNLQNVGCHSRLHWALLRRDNIIEVWDTGHLGEVSNSGGSPGKAEDKSTSCSIVDDKGIPLSFIAVKAREVLRGEAVGKVRCTCVDTQLLARCMWLARVMCDQTALQSLSDCPSVTFNAGFLSAKLNSDPHMRWYRTCYVLLQARAFLSLTRPFFAEATALYSTEPYRAVLTLWRPCVAGGKGKQRS